MGINNNNNMNSTLVNNGIQPTINPYTLISPVIPGTIIQIKTAEE